MSLLTICQSIARNSKVSVPSTIIGNTADEAVLLLECLKKSTKALLKAYDWQELTKEHDFNTGSGTPSYALPSDFERIKDQTAWNNTNKLPMIGSLTSKEWQNLQNATTSSNTPMDYYRIFGSLFYIFPTPSATEAISYEYIRNTPVEDSGGTPKTDWTVDTDVPAIDAYLVELGAEWRFRRINGKPYQEEYEEYTKILLDLIASDGGKKAITSPKRTTIKLSYPESVVAP